MRIAGSNGLAAHPAGLSATAGWINVQDLANSVTIMAAANAGLYFLASGD